MKILKSKFFTSLIAWLLHKYCLFVYHTSRKEFEGEEYLELAAEDNSPIIFTFWHSRIALMPFATKEPENTYAIISRHGDGELLAKMLKNFKIKQIRGSSNRTADHKKGAKDRGGFEAIKESVRILKEGKHLAITPDGPKGPRMRVKENFPPIAKMTGARIVPMTLSCSNSIILRSWDRFMFPLPFGKVKYIFGEAVKIPRDGNEEDLEKARKDIENRLNNITREADEYIGITPTEPE